MTLMGLARRQRTGRRVLRGVSAMGRTLGGARTGTLSRRVEVRGQTLTRKICWRAGLAGWECLKGIFHVRVRPLGAENKQGFDIQILDVVGTHVPSVHVDNGIS